MLFKKMVLFAIIAIIVIFDHYYKFCDVFKVKFERIRNIPKPNVFIPKLPVFPALRTRLLNIQTQLRDVLGTKLFYMCRCGVAMFLIRKHAFSCTY